MLAKSSVKASLAFAPGKYTQAPNIILVPSGRKTFPVGIEWAMEAERSHVIGSAGHESGNRWCVLDADLKQVMRGTAGKAPKCPKKAEPFAARTISGGGAHNPHHVEIELSSSGLRHGGRYTLVAQHHGVMAAGDFVAVHEPKLKKAPRRKSAARKKLLARGRAKKK